MSLSAYSSNRWPSTWKGVGAHVETGERICAPLDPFVIHLPPTGPWTNIHILPQTLILVPLVSTTLGVVVAWVRATRKWRKWDWWFRQSPASAQPDSSRTVGMGTSGLVVPSLSSTRDVRGIISGFECLPSTSHKVALGPAHMPSG